MVMPMSSNRTLTGIERTFSADDLIVSKTDKTGKITYANEVFLSISGYTEKEVIGKPHSLIRHPHMPRTVFKLLWETIESGLEIFAYVVNRAKNGDHYWVFAHVTPNCTPDGAIVGYHSSRRVARPAALAKIQPIYQSLLIAESKQGGAKTELDTSYDLLQALVRQAGYDGYDRFVLSL
jgi:PAS domain S-box-containing protein